MDPVAQPTERTKTGARTSYDGAAAVNAVRIRGSIDEKRRLSADVPDMLSPGPVTIWIVPADEDDAGDAWVSGVAEQWAEELGDVRQDIYTLADGEPVCEA